MDEQTRLTYLIQLPIEHNSNGILDAHSAMQNKSQMRAMKA